jgi:hypothetical protein
MKTNRTIIGALVLACIIGVGQEANAQPAPEG